MYEYKERDIYHIKTATFSTKITATLNTKSRFLAENWRRPSETSVVFTDTTAMTSDLVQPVEHGGLLTQSTWSATGRREICGRNSSPLAYLSVLQTRYPLLTVCHVARKYVWCDATGEKKVLPQHIDSYWQTLVVLRQLHTIKVIICPPARRYRAIVGIMWIDIPAMSKANCAKFPIVYNTTEMVNISFLQLISHCRSQWSRGLSVLFCGRSVARIEGSNTAKGMDVCLVSVVCCRAEVSAKGRPLVQRSPTECDIETSKWWALGPLGAVEFMGGGGWEPHYLHHRFLKSLHHKTAGERNICVKYPTPAALFHKLAHFS